MRKLIKKILCKLKIHFSGLCKDGAFQCPDCGHIMDVYTKYPYTREEISEMSPQEFKEKEKVIFEQIKRGLIK